MSIDGRSCADPGVNKSQSAPAFVATPGLHGPLRFRHGDGCHSSPTAEGAHMKILIAYDQPLVHDTLKSVVAELFQNVLVLEAESPETLCAMLAANPEVELLIFALTSGGAQDVARVRATRKARGDLPIIVFSACEDPATARGVLGAGASGFVSSRMPRPVLRDVLRLVLCGGTYVPLQALRRPDDGAREMPSVLPRSEPVSAPPAVSLRQFGLTPRQIEVLALLMEGKPNKSICRALQIAENTVKAHMSATYRALGVTSRTQAVCKLAKLGVRASDVSVMQPAGRVEMSAAFAAQQERRASLPLLA